MYDYVKIVINNISFANDLLNNALLNFSSPIILNTGEFKDHLKTADYKNLIFMIYISGRVEIKGSLHKYWNDGKHNYNDFNLRAIRETIKDLHEKFNINPSLARLSNLEVGLNIITPFNPNDLLSSIIAFKSSSFNQMRTKGPGFGKDVYFQQFGVKFYNKAMQYFRHENILRFEKKYIKMICLGWGDVFLSDLLKFEFAAHCINDLLKCFDEMIITEVIDSTLLSKNENRIYEFCNNPLNWGKMTRKHRYKYKNQFADIVQTFGRQNFKVTIRELLFNKGNELINAYKSGYILTDIKNAEGHTLTY